VPNFILFLDLVNDSSMKIFIRPKFSKDKDVLWQTAKFDVNSLECIWVLSLLMTDHANHPSLRSKSTSDLRGREVGEAARADDRTNKASSTPPYPPWVSPEIYTGGLGGFTGGVKKCGNEDPGQRESRENEFPGDWIG